MSDCQHCGCNISKVLGQQIVCDHCGSVMGTVTREPVAESQPSTSAVVWHVITCPDCGSDETKVTSTRRPIRHHKCLACQSCFKSYESRRRLQHQ
jgi:Zn finger protein HypA/HybF involved in hydrogenase expression